MNKTKEYSPIVFRIEGRLFWCIWYTDKKDGDEEDGFLIEADRLKTFDSRETLDSYGEATNKELTDLEIAFFDVDRLRQEFDQIEDTRTVDCHRFLNFWNMVSDAACSLKRSFYGDQEEVTPVYHRVFYGTNPPTLRKGGEYFTPTWTNVDLKVLQAVFEDGIKLLKSAL
ncbi:hypothetical protein [Saccharibacillus qingshengii]|uniref:hypothetical protein n=1 Tax=Saccharibacillus qingshengii TaxID=1763540 RepID=UPI00155517DD|nr:hypothetical protein [Saccharibacillus qingshengii]